MSINVQNNQKFLSWFFMYDSKGILKLIANIASGLVFQIEPYLGNKLEYCNGLHIFFFLKKTMNLCPKSQLSFVIKVRHFSQELYVT